MKRFKGMMAGLLVACSVFLVAGSAGAASTAWTISEGDNSNGIVGLTRYSPNFSPGTYLAVYSEGQNDTKEILNSTYWSVTLTYSAAGLKLVGLDDKNKSVDLGTLSLNSKREFSFFYFDGKTINYDLDYDVLGDGKYDLKINATQIANLHDFSAKPVPIPAAIFLFGSGLAGLVGLKRRKSNS